MKKDRLNKRDKRKRILFVSIAVVIALIMLLSAIVPLFSNLIG
jgi:cytochrome c oxidase assembly protein Cox11